MIESSSVHPLTTIIADDEKAVDNVLDQLPTLDDVLYRHSQPPVCLYNYYIVLRDRLQLEMWLDFWLDVAQADILYKRYLKYQRSTKKVMSVPQLKKPSIASSLFSNSDRNDILTHMLLLQPRASLANTITSTATTKRTPPPTQMEMIECVERIYLRYIVPSAEKELVQLPIEIKQRIHQYFSLSNVVKDNPAVYAEAKEYVHHLLETITFPLFLRYKVFMNLTLPQQIGRLAAGLFLLLFGFSLEFSLIFLDIRPWQKRLWVTIYIYIHIKVLLFNPFFF